MTDDLPRVVVVGSGWRFASGISYYTCRLVNALAQRYDVAAVLMRKLVPTRLYPGRARVGLPVNRLRYADGVRVFDGVDWYALPSLVRAVRFLRRERPDVLVLQWWTGAVLHSYLVLSIAARLLGARVVIEFHEVQDTGEATHRLAAAYVRRLMRPLLRRVDGAVLHSEYDRELLDRSYGLAGVPTVVVPHGPYDHHLADGKDRADGKDLVDGTDRAASADPAELGFPAEPKVCRLLFFGTIRPYKGLEDLIRAFDALDDDAAARLTLTVVGETWEGWTEPLDLIRNSPRRSRMHLVNRYVTDDEVAAAFAAADAVVLPYHRSSASGPLHIAMSHGLPVVVTEVGGLGEAAHAYEGALFVPPANPASLTEALRTVGGMAGKRYADPHSWQHTVAAYTELLSMIGGSR